VPLTPPGTTVFLGATVLTVPIGDIKELRSRTSIASLLAILIGHKGEEL
jgi:hypothetical protein